MQMQRDIKQRIYFHGSFMDAEELDDCIKTLDTVATYMQELIDTGDLEDGDLDLELDIIRDLLTLFSDVK